MSIIDKTGFRGAGMAAIGIYILVYSASLYVLSGAEGFSLVEPLFVLATLGLAFPLLAIFLTGNARMPEPLITRPKQELAAVLMYLTWFAVGVLGYGFTVLKTSIVEPQSQSMALLAIKSVSMVMMPVALLGMFGHRWQDVLAMRWNGGKHWKALLGVGLALLAFQAVFGRGLITIGELAPSPLTLAWAIPACFVFLLLEVGLCEEIPFRVILQSRLSAVLNSELAAVCLASLLFGLAHAPGLYLRGASLMEGADAHPTLTWAIAYSIAIISPAGILFGVLWSRTRSLGLLIVLHALTDLLPNLAEFIETWSQSS
ncbi:MAG TPA: CPBP family intramembrane metalloprotease [Arenimonas sp.]|nr:CPBP family intramembrane metalloprotease [Arenimonas sp.]